MVAYVVALSIFLGLLASAVMADRVLCRPLIRKDRVIGFCFTVCNTPRPDEPPCKAQGCIYDLHLKIVRSNCLFRGIIRIPKYWTGVIQPKVPGPEFYAKTPPATGAGPNPILPYHCKDFCLRITPRCISPGQCILVWWETTDEQGEQRQQGVVRCCWPTAAAG